MYFRITFKYLKSIMDVVRFQNMGMQKWSLGSNKIANKKPILCLNMTVLY